MCRKHRILLILLLIGSIFVMACDKLDAEKEANKGKKALLHCEFAKAQKHLSKAHSLYSSHKDILIGYAIAELAAFADTDAMRALFADLGVRSLSDVCLEKIGNGEGNGEGKGDAKEAPCNPIELSEWRGGNGGAATSLTSRKRRSTIRYSASAMRRKHVWVLRMTACLTQA